jgi:glycine/serine hydroxymethyltransferase
MEKPEIVKIADLIDAAMVNHDNKDVLGRVSEEVLELCKRFPVYN